jgi:hypothetical protein
MKAYSIASGQEIARPELIAAARQITEKRLESANDTIHYGVGFVGIHDGKTANFVFVDWWADENELHHHLYISPPARPADLRYQTPAGPLACVWDLALIAFEREAWINTALKLPSPELDRYLGQTMNAAV